jgi:type I restriction enzyme S subunit
MPQNIGDNRISSDGIARITMADAERLSKYRVKPGDIVYSRRGDVERRALVRDSEDGWLCGTGCLRVRLGDGPVDPIFAAFYLGAAETREWIVRHAHGATMPNLNTSILSACPIIVPPLPEQRAIAATLGALDDKIELNRKMNATLEAMARALFRDWFVDFGPTRAKMEGRAPYLSPDLWSLFPDRLDDEGKPEGWEVFTLGQIAEHHTKSLTPAKMADGEVEHFSLPAFDKGQIPAIDHGATIKSNKTLVPAEAILLSKLNPEIPRIWMPESQGRLLQVTSTEFLAYTAKGGAGRSFLFCLFSDQGFREMLHGMVTGTSKSHQRISPPSLLGRDVVVGAKQMFGAFEKLVVPLLERVRANRAESRTLAQTRDLLLPRLMSGELRVAEAERAVEAGV